MPRQLVSIPRQPGSLDIVSHGRRGPGDGQLLTPAQIDQVRRTVHKTPEVLVVLSMPAPTPPEAVLAAARTFAREHFALQHRYAMVLHTDQKHPHVHLVVKADNEFEPGKRLHIRKATLRQWREDFARCLREQGVAANATPAPLRARTRTNRKDPIHQRLKALSAFDALPAEEQARRPVPRPSTFMRAKVEAVAEQLLSGRLTLEPGKEKLLRTREDVLTGWRETAAALRAQGEATLANEVDAFVRSMPRVHTEQERIAAGLLIQIRQQREQAASRDPPAERG